ncbi:MAG: bifunctional 2-C-methyl-D-erythritol 4-phosphate cytidylyltransferase/2-C-methyl-D-erythritol 2,4-cyclodiphosphate synthase [Campylobacteraceae bacterium]
MLDISLIVLSAGDSNRFKTKVKKQWLRVNEAPLWLEVTNRLVSHYDFKEIFIASNKDELFYMQRFCDYKIITGGNTRQESLKNALLHVKTKYVIVSDVARANIPKALVLNLINSIKDFDNVTPYIKAYDTVVFGDETIDRDSVKLIQTPQLSLTSALKNALNQEKEFTDDSSAIKAIDGKVKYIEGDKKAKKLTFKDDREEILHNFAKPSKNSMSGLGYDVHAYEENKEMILGGVKVHDTTGFKAHSDGDVLIHSIIDALLGAAGAGDIGEWFPDTDARYKGANSVELLKTISNFIRNVGFEIVNIDTTIVAEFPKISPYKSEIAKNLAKTLDIPAYKINIKATTSEKMGFVGRKEGVAVHSLATLKFFDWTVHENINN